MSHVPGPDTLSGGGRLLGVGVKPGSRDLLALGRRLGIEAAGDAVVALGEVGVSNTTVAAALIAAVLGVQPAAVVGLGAEADTEMLDRYLLTVAAALRRAQDRYGYELLDPLVVLRAFGRSRVHRAHRCRTRAAEGGAVIVLDGLATSVAALITTRLEPGVAAHMIAGQRSREVAHGMVVEHLGLEQLLDLRIRAGKGVGACLASGLIGSAVRIRNETGRTMDPPRSRNILHRPR